MSSTGAQGSGTGRAAGGAEPAVSGAEPTDIGVEREVTGEVPAGFGTERGAASEEREITGEEAPPGGERADLLEALAAHRFFLRHTTRNLTDEQAARRTTVSELCLGGLIKHVAETERRWVDFILNGPAAMPSYTDPAAPSRRADEFRMLAGDTLVGLLDRYGEIAWRTDSLVRNLPDLDASQPLPPAPWFPPDTRWSARRVLLHIIAETSQHAGHADIIREALDGAKSMG